MARVTVASSSFSFMRQERNMVWWRDTGGGDQVGSPSPAGPGILEPARGRGAERGVSSSPAAPRASTASSSCSLQDTVWASAAARRPPLISPAPFTSPATASPSQHPPSPPVLGHPDLPWARPATATQPSGGGPQTREEGRSPPGDLTPALVRPTGEGQGQAPRGGEAVPARGAPAGCRSRGG